MTLKVRGSFSTKQIFFNESVPDRAIQLRTIYQAKDNDEYNKIEKKLKSKKIDFLNTNEVFVDYAKIKITKNCFLRCKHCYVSGGEVKHTISKEFMFKIIDTLHNNGVASIRFTGGEPLMHNNVFEILDYAYKKDMFIHMTTNGILFNDHPEFIKRVKEYEPIIFVSLDGPDIESHEAIRGPNTFNRTVNAIKKLRENEVTVRVTTTLNSNVIDRLEKMLLLLKSIDVRDWGLQELFLLGRAEINNSIVPEYDKVIFFLKRLQKLVAITNEIEVHGYLFNTLQGKRSLNEPLCKDHKYRVELEACEDPNSVDIEMVPWPPTKNANMNNFDKVLKEQLTKSKSIPYEIPSKEVCSGCAYRFRCLLSPYSKTSSLF
jgi:MoaA/NifB/PqqE/SkfB family radical SAM enzyme